MGQKVNPIGLRVAINKDWSSRWFTKKSNFGDWIHEDLKIRDHVKKLFYHAAVAKVKIERFANRIRITIFSARPGLLIGRKGAELDSLKDSLGTFTDDKEIFIDIVEIKKAEINAQLVSENIAMQLERRISFRRAMKKAIQTAMEMGVDGIKVRCSGRLGGAELSRTEQYKEGRIPLHTLRANIDYGFAEANTTAGKIGVKVWICNNEPTEEQQYAIDAKKDKTSKSSAR